MEMDSPEHSSKRHAVVAVPVGSVMDISRTHYSDSRLAEVYGRTHTSETPGNPKENQHINHVSKAMHISSTLMLIIASIAAALFVGVFLAAVIITHGNRRTIQKYNGNWRNSRIAQREISTDEPKKSI